MPTPITISIIEASDLIPLSLPDFWEDLSNSDTDFTWGDNNRSIITASRFKQACESAFELQEFDDADVSSYKDRTDAYLPEVKEFLDMLENLGETYIDLEN